MYEDLIEKKISSEAIFDGVLLHVKRDTVKLPNGKEATREWIKHPGASSVIPLLPDGRIILVRQYRYPIDAVTLEVPAGKLDAPDEDPLVCAERELSEETGYTAEHITKLTTIATTVGFSNEKIHLYAAEGLTPGKQHTDEDEFISFERVPFDALLDRCLSGDLRDGKTVAGVLKVYALRTRKKEEK